MVNIVQSIKLHITMVI